MSTENRPEDPQQKLLAAFSRAIDAAREDRRHDRPESHPVDRAELAAQDVETLAERLYEWSGGIFWRGETTWQDRHREEARQWFTYAALLDKVEELTAKLDAAMLRNVEYLRRGDFAWKILGDLGFCTRCRDGSTMPCTECGAGL